MIDVKEKIWNIELLIAEIKSFPQTYKTILGECEKDGTCQTILRRKLNNLFKDGTLCKTAIPGTRFGQAIIYTIPKKYFILVEGTRTGSDTYCFFKHKKDGRYYIRVKECWKLNKSKWDKITKEKVFFSGNTLKWI